MVVQFELENLEMRPDPEPVLTDLIHAVSCFSRSLAQFAPAMRRRHNLLILLSQSIFSALCLSMHTQMLCS